MSGSMDDSETERRPDAEAILRQVVADFEQLDRTIDKAIQLLEQGRGGEAAALRRAREAARKGAELAKSKVAPFG
jgi:hypothetical protein